VVRSDDETFGGDVILVNVVQFFSIFCLIFVMKVGSALVLLVLVLVGCS